MADPGSSLALAIDWPNTMMPVVIQAARERLRLSRIPCETCGGMGGQIRGRPGHNTFGSASSGIHECPSCGGSGEVWPDELVEVVAITLSSRHGIKYWSQWLGDKEPWQADARAVLDALDLYAKEATK